MNIRVHAVLQNARERRSAARAGRRDGRLGLSVEEAADASYLAGLRRRVVVEQARIVDRLHDDVARLEQAAAAADDRGRALRARRAAAVERARAAVAERAAVYEELGSRYGRAWQRHHRDRRFARLGWRCPALPDVTSRIPS